MHPTDGTNQVCFHHLCSICQNLFNRDGAWATGGIQVHRKHHNINDLIESGKAGCHFCVKIVDDVKGSPWLLTELLDEYEQDPVHARCRVAIKVHSPDGYTPLAGKSVYDVTLHKEVRNKPVPRHDHWQFSFSIDDAAYPTSYQTSSQDSFEQLELWIRECTTGHDHCVVGRVSETVPDFLPTRLVDVGQTPYETPIHLCDGKSLPVETEYVTLSHCWGKKVSPELLKTNCSRFYNSIPQDQLSRTFADAIEVTRRLGRRYLWIDALCIIQDSKEDWNIEASTMGEVYSRSYLSIAATASTDGQGGLFRTRDPLSITPCRIVPAWEDFSREPLVYFDTSQYRTDMGEAPLNQRAWVVQERLLAPRVVHFTDRQLYWECAQLTASESLPRLGLNQGLKNWTISRANDKDRYRRFMHLFKTWNKILKAYTQCDLTISSDKLIAISGVAQKLKHLWGDESVHYHAGIWSFGMIQALLWQTSAEDQSTTRSKEYRAPSWSWASINGRIDPGIIIDNDSNSNTSQVCRAKILEVKLSHPISDFGAVSEGYLRIRGPLARMTCQLSLDESPEAYEYRITRVPKWYVITGEAVDEVGFFQQWNDWSWPLLAEIHADLIYLITLESRFFKSPVAHDKVMTGLLLRPTKSKGGQYERLGFFCITASKTYDLFEKAFASESIPDDLVLAGNRTAGYTIEIV